MEKKASVSERRKENPRKLSVLTSAPCKLLEKIIRDKIVKHMTDNALFSKAQRGFIKGKSCVTQLLELLEDTLRKHAYSNI